MSSLLAAVLGAAALCGVPLKESDFGTLVQRAREGGNVIQAFQDEFSGRLARSGVTFEQLGNCLESQLEVSDQCLIIRGSEPLAEVCVTDGTSSKLDHCGDEGRVCVEVADFYRCICSSEAEAGNL